MEGRIRDKAASENGWTLEGVWELNSEQMFGLPCHPVIGGYLARFTKGDLLIEEVHYVTITGRGDEENADRFGAVRRTWFFNLGPRKLPYAVDDESRGVVDVVPGYEDFEDVLKAISEARTLATAGEPQTIFYEEWDGTWTITEEEPG